MQHVDFTRDEFGHPDSPFEWWYYVAFLETDSKEAYRYVTAFMRNRFIWVSYMRLQRIGSDEIVKPLAYPSFANITDGDQLVLRSPLAPSWNIELNRTGFSVHGVGPHARLSFRPKGGAVLHTRPEDGGIRRYGADNEMAWYSRPSLTVTGRVIDEQGDRVVSGIGWFEHQWGNTDFRRLTWRYVPLLFDNDERAIAFSYIHEDSNERSTEVALLKDGHAQVIQDATLDPLGPGPLATRITGPDTLIDVASEDGTIDLGIPLVPRFFEGASKASGKLLGRTVNGYAITEYHPA
jgi:predicted secreted hydrolase